MNGRSPGAELRALLAQNEIILAPGCGDALSALLIEEAGFAATCMSGGWTAATYGLLDVGFITLDEMVNNARAIARTVNIPVVADADTGFGGQLNVRRCVQEFEAAGVAGIHLEDQALPKKCGQMSEKRVISTEEMVGKLRAALDARSNEEFVIIARTDALEPEGLDRTADRVAAYFDAGVDMVMVEGFRTLDEITRIGQRFTSRHLMFNRTPLEYTPDVPADDLLRLGYTFVVYPVHLLLASIVTQRELLQEIQSTGRSDSFEEKMVNFEELFRIVGSDGLEEIEARYTRWEATDSS